MSSSHHWKHDSYSVDCYINYARSIALAVERRVMDNPPRRPAEFWRICDDELASARWRMRHVTGQIRKLGAGQS